MDSAGVLVAHMHHDHALDAPAIADQTGAVLVGGASTIHLGEAAFPNLQRCTVVDGADLAFGPYGVKVFKVPHGDTGWVLGKLLHGKTPNHPHPCPERRRQHRASRPQA
jgi:hypothetical protein